MPILSARNLTKRFPGVVALNNVSVSFESGSCHALMGENGAGKSTLGKVLAGLYVPDAGEVEVDGKVVHFQGPQDASHVGIAMVHQELLFAENMTVAENLSLGDIPRKGLFVDFKEMNRRAEEYLATVGANIDPNTRLGSLSISKQQLVQIAGGIGRGARILIFDEPTSSLSKAETDKLLELIQDLKSRNVACLYVSHRLDEVFAVCDTITVLRDGQKVDTVQTAEITRDQLVKMMIGREVLFDVADTSQHEIGEELLNVKNLSSPNKFSNVSFSVKKGEIVGLAGLVGAGRTEVVEALFGLDPMATGEVTVHGKPFHLAGPIQSMRQGMGLVPEDRKHHGLVLSMNARENVSLPILDELSKLGYVNKPDERSVAKKFFDRMRVKAPGLDSGTLGLSGGNQQKLVIAKWLAADSDILLVDEPTRGVDVGAKAEIHSLIRGLAAEGKAVVVVSSDLPELLALSTRLLVMREGQLVGELPANPGEEPVMRLMAGVS